ncbi:MAG: redoxin domain-containing protein [Pseudomonadales bacterium]|nr:redoxin domain-containing protein [Pseudomonadales bacterium]
MKAFDDAGVDVYALSYDEPDALRDFRSAHKITYNLLSDPDSEVIRSFGILNTLIDQNDHPWYGIPYPGTYVIDTQGNITHKFFENNLAVRAGPEQLLRAALGQTSNETGAKAVPKDIPNAVQMKVALAGGALTPTVTKDLVISFVVPSGRHVYAQPAPEGSVAVDVVLDEDARLVQRPLVRPLATDHTLLGTGESFGVHDGEFELRLPLTLNSAAGKEPSLVVTGEARWQSCDDDVCDIPTTERFSIELATTRSPASAIGNQKGAALEPNAMAHFQRMKARRTKT